jgi:hypothetical protein
MSNLKYDAIVGAGIEVGERVQIPDDLIPPMRASRWTRRRRQATFTRSARADAARLGRRKGRGL